MGRLIPAGTGISKYRSAKLLIEEPEEVLEPPMEDIEEDYGETLEEAGSSEESAD
jgi:DNA-directed RNA polymerase subunit beta'